MVRKTVSRRRKSNSRKGPSESATKFQIGTKKRGLDGGMWEIIKTSNGVQRWKKISARTSSNRVRTPTKKISKVSVEDLKRLTMKYAVAASGSKKTIAEGLWRVRGQAMSDKDLVMIMDLLPKRVQKIIEKQIKTNINNPIIDYKGMWRPLDTPISKMSRQELVNDLRRFRDAWEKITTRNQDLSNSRLADEKTQDLRKLLKFYYSDEAKKLAEKWLRE